MADIYVTATTVGVLLGGRAPVWSVEGAEALLPPPNTTSGIPLTGAVRTLFHVGLREAGHARTARLTIPTVDLTDVYTVTIGGVAVAYDATAAGAASRADIIDGIVAAITASGPASAIATAAATGTPHDTVVIRGVEEADYTINFTQSGGGSAVLACVADYTRGVLIPWWLPDARPGSTLPGVWAASPRIVVDRRGFVERYDTGGLLRAHAQLYQLSGVDGDGSMVTYRSPTVSVAPCLLEEGL